MRKDMIEYFTNTTMCRREIINNFFGFNATVKPLKFFFVCNYSFELECQFEEIVIYSNKIVIILLMNVYLMNKSNWYLKELWK
jgi:hypothetical protein